MNPDAIPVAERTRQAPPPDVPVPTWRGDVHDHARVAPSPFVRLAPQDEPPAPPDDDGPARDARPDAVFEAWPLGPEACLAVFAAD